MITLSFSSLTILLLMSGTGGFFLSRIIHNQGDFKWNFYSLVVILLILGCVYLYLLKQMYH